MSILDECHLPRNPIDIEEKSSTILSYEKMIRNAITEILVDEIKIQKFIDVIISSNKRSATSYYSSIDIEQIVDSFCSPPSLSHEGLFKTEIVYPSVQSVRCFITGIVSFNPEEDVRYTNQLDTLCVQEIHSLLNLSERYYTRLLIKSSIISIIGRIESVDDLIKTLFMLASDARLFSGEEEKMIDISLKDRIFKIYQPNVVHRRELHDENYFNHARDIGRRRGRFWRSAIQSILSQMNMYMTSPLDTICYTHPDTKQNTFFPVTQEDFEREPGLVGTFHVRCLVSKDSMDTMDEEYQMENAPYLLSHSNENDVETCLLVKDFWFVFSRERKLIGFMGKIEVVTETETENENENENETENETETESAIQYLYGIASIPSTQTMFIHGAYDYDTTVSILKEQGWYVGIGGEKMNPYRSLSLVNEMLKQLQYEGITIIKSPSSL